MIATNPMDIKANIKKHFDMVFNGEPVIVSRKENKVFNLEEVIPYKGAKPMYYLSDLENAEALKQIIFI